MRLLNFSGRHSNATFADCHLRLLNFSAVHALLHALNSKNLPSRVDPPRSGRFSTWRIVRTSGGPCIAHYMYSTLLDRKHHVSFLRRVAIILLIPPRNTPCRDALLTSVAITRTARDASPSIHLSSFLTFLDRRRHYLVDIILSCVAFFSEHLPRYALFDLSAWLQNEHEFQ